MDLIKQYENLVETLQELGNDVKKNTTGNQAAGIRTRRGLREVKELATTLQKASLSLRDEETN